jgi:hypothetical protein
MKCRPLKRLAKRQVQQTGRIGFAATALPADPKERPHWLRYRVHITQKKTEKFSSFNHSWAFFNTVQ